MLGKFFTYFCIAFMLLVIVISLTTCSSGEGKEVLAFFFDGVDEEEAANTEQDSLIVSDADNNNLSKKKSPEQVFYHEPYLGRGCDNCHELTGGNELLEPQPTLCFTCHDDFSTEQFTFLHGPVASGYCTRCHNPHLSKNPKLMKRKGRDICLYCHEQKDVLKNEVHTDIEDENCIECHNPHGGEDKFLM